MQDVAKLEKDLKNAQSELSTKTQQILEFANTKCKKRLLWRQHLLEELFETDPMGYMKAKMVYDKELGVYNEKVQNYSELHNERQKEQEKQLQDYTQDQTKILAEKLPDITHLKKVKC